MFLAMNRALLWESLEETFTTSTRSGNSLEELGAMVRNTTGALDSAALGVGANQRAIEGSFMAFSPRLLRSTITFTADAIRFAIAETAGRAMGGTGASVRQTEAAKRMAKLLTAIHGIFVTAAIANGAAKGHSVERIRDDIRVGMNPLSGKKYLSIEADGQWYGVGGQVRALVSLHAGLISALAPGGTPIGDLIARNSDNPLIRFIMFRGAVGVGLGQTIVEGLAGQHAYESDDPDDPDSPPEIVKFSNIDALKFDHVDSVPDIGFHMAEGSAPFVAQGIMEGDTAPGVILGMMGLRTSPISPGDEAMGMIRDAYDQMSPEELAEYGHSKGEWTGNLSPSALWDFTTADGFPRHKKDLSQALVTKMMLDNPEIREALNRQAEELKESGSESGVYKVQKEKDRAKRDDGILASLQANGVGSILRDDIQDHFKEYALDSRETETRHEGMLAQWEEGNEISNAFNRALDGYWSFMTLDRDGSNPPMIDPVSREYNFDERDRRIKVLENDPDIGPHMGHIEGLKYASAKPEVRILLKEYDNDIDLIRPYWEIIENEVEKSFLGKEKWLFYTTDPDVELDRNAYKKTGEGEFQTGAVPDKDWTAQDAEDLDALETNITDEQEDFLIKNPVVELLLLKWGYKTRPLEKGSAIMRISQLKQQHEETTGSYRLESDTFRDEINEAIRIYDPTYLQEFEPQLTR